MERRGPSHSGPFGLACTSCFKAKCKCVARPGGDGCQRCHRLNKQCRPSDSLRRRIDKKPNPTARIDQLESKLDALISGLESRGVLDGVDNGRQSSSSVLPEAPPADLADGLCTVENEAQQSDHGQDDDGDISESVRWSASPRAVAASAPFEPSVSYAEADTLLGNFRSCMLRHFAFLRIPDHLTARELQRKRPFLLRAITCVACPSAEDKAVRGDALEKGICDALLGVENQPHLNRIDPLLGILTYLSWGWNHVLNKGSPSRLMAQAVSLVHDLQPKTPASEDGRATKLFAPSFPSWSGNTATTSQEEFLERQRATLACFVLSSTLSICFGVGDALRWTPHMEDGLAFISANRDRDCPSDAIFAAQVRLQLLAQRSADVPHQQQLENGGRVAATESTSFLALVSLTSLQTQLQEFQVSLSPPLRQQNLITAHLRSAELHIAEATYAVTSTVSLMVSQFSRMANTSTAAPSGNPVTASSRQERLHCLWQSVGSVQACSAALLASTPGDFRGISVVQWAQLAHCAAVLRKLTDTIADPTWDKGAARGVIDLPGLVGRVADKLGAAGEVGGEREGDGMFGKLARSMREFCVEVEAAGGREEMQDAWPRTAWFDPARPLPFPPFSAFSF